ncbi:MAG: class IV adenylate cyclase [Eubacteriaceae bacterium]|nr:class IV adenylate cyclase [Eubacteriaceae bacterium]
MIESELKASLDGIDMDELRERIRRLGFTFKAKKRETDVYFNGAAAAGVQSGNTAVGGSGSPVSGENGSPAGREDESPTVGGEKAAACGRDFRKTDEALRVRTVTYEDGGTQSFITYKGPKQDMSSMTRTELQTDIGSGETAEAVFRALGYEPVFTVSKTREQYWNRDLLQDPALDRNWNPVTKHAMTLCLDEVDGLGRFLEIEIMVAGQKGVGAARANLHQMLDVLMIPQENATTVSYLEQLMKR